MFSATVGVLAEPGRDETGQVPGHQTLGPPEGGGAPMDVGAQGSGKMRRDTAR
jgi:hypothetical protein